MIRTIRALIQRWKQSRADARLGIVRDKDGTPHYGRAL